MRFLKLILFTVVFSTGMVSCGTYHKLLKSTDSEKKYTEAVKYYYNKDYNKAKSLFMDIASLNQGSMREDTILFFMGKSLYYSALYEEAAEMMSSFRYKYTRSAFTEESEYIYAMCFYQQSGDFEKDQSGSFKAIQAFNEYLNRYPESIKADDIYQMIDEMSKKIYRKRFSNASIYYKLGKYNAAITALRSVLKQYPEIPYKEEMMYLICKSWFDYAEGSVEGRKLDRYLKMMDSYYSYKSEFPDNVQRLKELDPMFERSKSFTDERGFQTRAIVKNTVDIEKRLKTIDEKKDKRFFATTKAERQKITDEIKYEQEQLKLDRKQNQASKKELKFQKTQAKNAKKQAEANAHKSPEQPTVSQAKEGEVKTTKEENKTK